MRTIKLLIICVLLLILIPQITKSQAPIDPTVWKFKTSGAVYSTPLIQNDSLFIGSLDSCFYAINALTGQQLWKYKTKSQINTTASIYKNNICFGSGNYLYGLDLKGSLKWEFKMYDGQAVIQNDAWDYFNSSPRLVDSIAYIGTEKGLVYGINVNNGQQLFKCQATDDKNTVETTPIIYDGKIFFGNYNGFFYAYDLNTSQKVWEYDTNKDNGKRGSDPVIMLIANAAIYKGNICFGGRAGYFYCLNPETEEKIWQYHDPQGLWILGLTIQDSSFYMGSSYQLYVRSINALNGKQNWLTGVDYISYGSPFADTTYLFSGTGDDASENKGSLFAIDKITGEVKERYTIDGRVQSSPILYKNNIYFGSSNGYVYAINKSKFINRIRPKLVIKSGAIIDFGIVKASDSFDTTIYVSNIGVATDSVTMASAIPRKEIIFEPNWSFIKPGDSVGFKVSVNITGFSKNKYSWRFKAISNYSVLNDYILGMMTFQVLSETNINIKGQDVLSLRQFPNPLSGYGIIEYSLLKKSNVYLSIFDDSGREIRILYKGFKLKGTYQVEIDRSKLLQGVYYCRLTSEGNSLTKKIIVK